MNEFLNIAIESAYLAGKVIIEHYQQFVEVKHKNDGSPLTIADKAAHRIINTNLKNSGLLVVSEEGDDLALETDRYWLVDPLDGTKEFLAGNDEFTINIALIEEGRSVLGVVFAPAIGDLYYGVVEDMEASHISHGNYTKLIPQERASDCRVATSRFHDHPDVAMFTSQNDIKNHIAIGSALKYCLLATAEIDVFPRLVGSSEWDTAAGQAVLEATGGKVLDWETGESLRYGKPKRRNPRILAIRSPYRYEEFKLKKYLENLL